MSGNPRQAFDAAADAVVSGDLATLSALLQTDPSLATRRSQRSHEATLLHYVAANGVEAERQASPPNAVAVAGALLDAGADADALSMIYGGGPTSTTLCLLVSSVHPYEAGVQAPLVECLCAAGASPDGVESDGAPMRTALGFRYVRAAEALAAHGARVEHLVDAAGVGRLARVRDLLGEPPSAPNDLPPYEDPFGRVADTAESIVQIAFSYACQGGHRTIAELLLRAGAGISGGWGGQTGLHYAAFAGERAMAEWLLSQGADPSIEDCHFGLSPAGWAEQGGHEGLVDRLAVGV